MATDEVLSFSGSHEPHPKAIHAFRELEHEIKQEIIKSRHNWDKHQPEMWSRAKGLDNDHLIDFTFKKQPGERDLTDYSHKPRGDGGDLVLVDNARVSYGEIILGKIRIPAIPDGYIHVRIHDFLIPTEGQFKFHSLFTYEGDRDSDGHHSWKAIQTAEEPLKFFNE